MRNRHAEASAFRACALVPCHDEERSIGAVVARASAQLPVLVVDDGSGDATARVAADAGAQVVRHDRNRGKGAALRTGLQAAHAAGFTHVVCLDGDGQHDAAELPRLLAAARAEPDALVIGARDFDVPNVPGSSRFGRNFSNFWVRLETGRALSDTQSGYRVYPVAHALALDVPPSRFEWEVEVIVRAAWAGLPIVEVPVSVRYLPPGEHRSHYRGYVDSARISWLHTRLVLRRLLRPVWAPRRLLPA
jgi:glycosyltransferase involved in cell wall biosynthesis